MIRSIVGLRGDALGGWTAELSCGHVRRVAGASPGSGIDCALCEGERGGEAACYAHLVCPECGAVLDGAAHDLGCGSR